MRVRVRVPATSANLGPGFDVLGLALSLHNEVHAEEADGVSVVIEGEGAGRLETGERNVVARAVRMAFEAADRPFRGVALRCVNRISVLRDYPAGPWSTLIQCRSGRWDVCWRSSKQRPTPTR